MTEIEKEAFINLIFIVREILDTVELPKSTSLKLRRGIDLVIEKALYGGVRDNG